MPSFCSTLADQLEVCLGSAWMDGRNVSGGGSGSKKAPSWGEQCLGCAKYRSPLFKGQGKREWGTGGVQKGNEVGSYNCAWDKTGDSVLLGSPESKEAANSSRDPQQAAAQPVAESGVLRVLEALSPIPSELGHRSPSPAAAHGAAAPRRSSRAHSRARSAAGNAPPSSPCRLCAVGRRSQWR